jgi:hypothetical protein
MTRKRRISADLKERNEEKPNRGLSSSFPSFRSAKTRRIRVIRVPFAERLFQRSAKNVSRWGDSVLTCYDIV